MIPELGGLRSALIAPLAIAGFVAMSEPVEAQEKEYPRKDLSEAQGDRLKAAFKNKVLLSHLFVKNQLDELGEGPGKYQAANKTQLDVFINTAKLTDFVGLGLYQIQAKMEILNEETRDARLTMRFIFNDSKYQGGKSQYSLKMEGKMGGAPKRK